MFSKRHVSRLLLLTLALGNGVAYAYNSTAASTHCDKPIFSDFQPAANKYLQSFDEFSFIASANTTATSLEASISAGPNHFHFSHKDLKIEPMKSGRYQVTGKIPRPFSHGFIRLDFTGHSKPGCVKHDGYLLRIQ